MAKRIGFVLFLLLWVVGCAGNPAAEQPSDPGISPTPAVTESPTHLVDAAKATSTEPPPIATLIASPTPAIQVPTVRIQNVETGSYLMEADGRAVLGDGTGLAGLWLVEDYQGAKRLRNLASENYLSIENLQPYVEVLEIFPEWMSPRWTLIGDPAQEPVAIRNVWHNWQILYVADGLVKYENVPNNADNARWIFEPVDGAALAASTPIPAFEMPPVTNQPGSRGAQTAWLEYEAETGVTNAEILAPERTFGTIAAESSGRSAVRLDEAGEYVEWTSQAAANSIVVRYVIPDSEDGSGLQATLSLFVDGVFRQKLTLTSKYAWSYGGAEETFNVPKAGGAHHFYDEARALVGEIPAGAEVRLQIDAGDAAAYYVIDLVDLELVAPPLTMPEGYVSIEECGAVADDGTDDSVAIQGCIYKARAAQTGMWIPAGTFESNTLGFEVEDVIIQGAGMWYSTIRGSLARFTCVGNNCRYADFAILGETVLRDDRARDVAFEGGAGTGSRLENIWVEHTKVGYWVGAGTHGLVITGSRFRNLFADGVNFCNGTSYSLIENSHFRNTGDDALASWSPGGDGVNTGNVFRFNTVQLPWRANCFAIYGGKDNSIEDNLCMDVVTYPGILIAQQFGSNPFDGVTSVQRNTLIRAGGPMFNLEHGALKIWSAQGEIAGLVVRDIIIEAPTFSGLQLDGIYPISGAVFENITITDAGTAGMHFSSLISGDASFASITISGSAGDAFLNYSPKLKFLITFGDGNTGWQYP